jgi:hypothetical protein
MSAAKSMGFACSPPPYLSLAQAPAPAPAQSSGPDLAQTALTIGINYASGGAGILDSTVSIPRIAGRIIIYMW